MIRTWKIPQRRHWTAVLLFALLAMPGCVIYATAAPQETARETAPETGPETAMPVAPPPTKRDTDTQKEAARVERERIARERAERERAEAERIERERAEKERLEKERLGRERAEAEKERVEKKRVEKEPVGRPDGDPAGDDEARGPRKLEGVPPGHFPKKADQCRLWLVDTPPGRQPKAEACTSLLKIRIPAGAFILHADRAWDTGYDWAAQAEIEPESVPDPILKILRTRLVEAES